MEMKKINLNQKRGITSYTYRELVHLVTKNKWDLSVIKKVHFSRGIYWGLSNGR